MSGDDFDMEEEIKARIPKNFNPQKYNIKFYFDVLNLIYNVNGEIILTSLTDNPQYLIINALTSKYEIKSMNILKFDKIMDDWKVIQTYYLESLPNPKDNIEECIYFPLENIIVDDLLKIEFEVEGEVELLNLTGLAVNFNEPKIQSLKKNKLSNIWENKIKEWPKEKLKENPIIESLVLSVVSEPNFIRLIFPCFDEPCYKSVFSFQLILDKYYMDAFPKLKCVTNGSLINVEPIENNSKYLFTYKDTPLMSIYLFTFVVGNYDMIETVNENNIKIRVFTPLKNHHDGALAMNMIQNGIKFYHNFFNIKYYYDKIDLVPIPDMSFRAVENLGCIVFINYAMLFGHFQSILEKKLISRTCCHELSHMWFGNLVTMEWWNDIWLNEGFARLFEYLCLNSFENEKMKYWDNYIELIYESALTSDERISTHPINVEVPSARNIEEIFDNISYAKGSSVIRMLYYYLGEDLFKKSIRLYMEENKFKNTTTEILWKCFNNVTQLDILTLMNEWVNIPSHPILSIEINKNNINIKQTAYNNSDLLWKIPLFVKCSKKEKIILMESKEINIDFKDLNLIYDDIENGTDYIIINSDLKGFYRVDYDGKNENNIIDLYKKQNDKVNYNISEYDIFGILSMKLMKEDWRGLIEILQKLKPINSYLLLKYTKGIYQKVLTKKCYLEGYESVLDEINQKKEEEKVKEINNIFLGLIDNDPDFVKKIENKFYINEDNKDMYKDQYNDEYESVFLYFLCIIGDNVDVVKKMFMNDLKDFEFMNKNYKYIMIEAIMKNINLLETDVQVKYYDEFLKDYISNYYVNSTLIKRDNQNALLNFDNCSKEVIELLINKIFSEANDIRYSFSFSQLFKRNKSKLNIFCSLMEGFHKNYINSGDKTISFLTYLKNNRNSIELANKFMLLRKLLLYVGNDKNLKIQIIEKSISTVPEIKQEDKEELFSLFL